MLDENLVLLLERNSFPQFRVLVREGGQFKPRTGWCATLDYAESVMVEYRKGGWVTQRLTEDEATTEQGALFAMPEKTKYATRNGYSLGDCASAMQKAIRRGDEQMAFWWARELEQPFYKYVWKRLSIIAGEDIGMADPQAAILISALRSSYMFVRENNRGKQGTDHESWNILAHATTYLARAPKSRDVNEMAFVTVVEGQKSLPEIPDEAYDMHTQLGRSKGRGAQHFIDEASKLDNDQGDHRYREEARRYMLEGE